MRRRINVDSGRPLEAKAQYSRAIRINDLVLQSGTTAIDLSGNIMGDNVVAQTAAIFDIAKASMDVAEGRFEDIVKVRAFIVGQENLQTAAEAINNKFQEQRFVLTLIPTSQLARPTQLIEIELEAIDDARSSAVQLSSSGTSDVDIQAIRIDKRLLFSGATTSAGDEKSQTQLIIKEILSTLDAAGAMRGDLTSLRIFVRDRDTATSRLQEIADILDDVKPVISIMEVSSFEHAKAHVMIEAEAFVGAATNKQITVHPQFNRFANALAVDDQIYLSNIEPLDVAQQVVAPNDWGAQRDFCIEKLQAVLHELGASLDDVINRRYFTYVAVEQNRGYDDGPAWFKATRPAALGCRVANHLNDGTALTLEAHVIRGAGENIEWRKIAS